MATDPTNLVEGDDTSATDTAASDTGVDQHDETETEQQFDDDGNPIEEPEEDEEVDLEDFKLTLPKSQAEKARLALLRQSDYTKKTQVLADDRKAFETERQTVVQATNDELFTFAQVANINQQIAQYENTDWNRYYDDDPFEAQKAFANFQLLDRARQQAVGHLSNLRNQRLSAAQQETAKRVEEGRAVLTREIGWNDDTKAKLETYALGQGLSRDDLSDLEASPAAAKILHAAYQWHEHSQKTQKAQRHVTAQQAQPAAKAGGSGAPPSGLDDRLSQAEWLKRREAQLRKKAG